MDGCGFTLDPTAINAAIETCLGILERPDSAANLMRGVMVVASFLAFTLGFVAGVRRLWR